MTPPFDLIRRNVRLGLAVKAPLSETGPAADQAQGPRLIDFLPWAFPPWTSIPIDVVDVQSVAAATTVTILVLDPTANTSVFRFFGNESTAFAGYADLRWSILLNGVPFQPYVTMRESRGLISNPDPVMIPVPKSTRVQVTVQNLSAVNAWEAKTRLKGWIF